MSDFNADNEGRGGGLSRLSDQLSGLGAGSAQSLSASFGQAGEEIAQNLEKAAQSGEASFDAMVSSIQKSLGSLGGGQGGSLADVLGSFMGGGSGARADGGPVTSGGRYLVGERGPEVFTPASSGEVRPAAQSQVSVTMHVHGAKDAESIRRSQNQISAAVARAVARGQKDL